jgi:predicted outer membrane repeat protein
LEFAAASGGTANYKSVALTTGSAGPIVVNSTSDTATGNGIVTLRDAIVAANASSTPTTITFDPTVFATAQTITLAGTQLELSNTAEATTITGPASGVTINCGGQSQFLLVDSNVTASIANLTIENGSAVGANSADDRGGAIECDGNLTVEGCAIVDCHALTLGGGIDAESGTTLVITNTTFTGDSADENGGAIFGHAVTVTNSAFTGNSAQADGGGISTTGTVTVLNTTFSGNTAGVDGGGISTSGTVDVTDSTFTANNAGTYGGAISTSGSLTVSDSTLSGNSAAGGGGISTDGTTTLANTIVAANTASTSGGAPDASGVFASLGHNLIGVLYGSSGWGSSDLIGTLADPLNPDLAPLGNNGGPTQTLLPQSGSPAIAAGSVALVPSGVTTDQRGLPRTVNGAVDIGAVEVQSGGQTGVIATSTTLSTSSAIITSSQSLTLTATVSSAGHPTGEVTFLDNGGVIGTGQLANGTAIVSTALPVGSNSITASYSGDTNYAPSASAALAQTILPVSSATPIVRSVSAPTTGVAGSKFIVKVPILITNAGSTLNGQFAVVLYLDLADSGLDADPIQLDKLLKHAVLKNGKGFTAPLRTSALPASIPSGTYHLVAEVTDPLGNVNFVTSTQTVTIAAAFVRPAATVGAVAPSSIAPGKSGSLILTVANDGNVAAGAVTISLSPSFDDSTPIAGVFLDQIHSGARILPGKSKSFRLHFKVPSGTAAGTYYPYLSVTLGGVTTTKLAGAFTVS